MKFYISTGFMDTGEILEIAKAADELGYDGLGIPDHVVNFAELQTPYPYSDSGDRRWEPFTDWADPWVLIGSLAQLTTRLRFVTTVYVAALRDPYSAAKSIGTAAYLSQGRVELGLGVGWCREEFELLGAQFSRRGKRSDEMVELMRELWAPGWTEFHGEFYQTPKLEMSPPAPHIPVLVGGRTEHALRRAAAHDGWIGDLLPMAEALTIAARLRALRAEAGKAMDDFTILAPLNDAFTPDQYARAEEGGITHILTMPWMFYSGPNAGTDEKIKGLERFRGDMGLVGS
ncbi:TIGR03619 family F420-dependent LLM class oxidoreductase [Mycobacterium sp. TNTM28]|uniref:TIGR03619 family F420-dependent LLM class oxidoreductase n=1 Tax=[Mycobacterium] fortunisiensis TaxID=2600579 RepID=A0ABS6KHX8_9MYCO|nr:TIGR03619 family F420-dependent LLM class oxidoreductase [[Mycobacterium] fortunisiensis]MBU9763169.1 TIGR03619 family F420-dependent LLM class oxidoreductase [[Mycobacterium] fortunisiensis]